MSFCPWICTYCILIISPKNEEHWKWCTERLSVFWGGHIGLQRFVHVQCHFQPLPTELVFAYFDRGSYIKMVAKDFQGFCCWLELHVKLQESWFWFKVIQVTVVSSTISNVQPLRWYHPSLRYGIIQKDWLRFANITVVGEKQWQNYSP